MMTPRSDNRKSKKSAKQRIEKNTAAEEHCDGVQEDPHQTRPKPTLALQQSLLDVFRDNFSECFKETLLELIQQVKGHLFDRDFCKAFGSKPLLEAYSLRWSPSRALAYLDLVCGLPQILAIVRNVPHDVAMPIKFGQASLPPDSASATAMGDVGLASATFQTTLDCTANHTTITCFGGGAGAEIMAFAGFVRCLWAWEISGPPGDQFRDNSEATGMGVFTLKVVDMADWSTVIGNLRAGATTAPPLSKYAASNSKNEHGPFVNPRRFQVDFELQDILSVGADSLAKTVRDSTLITLFFTLNELYSASMSKTTNFMLTLTSLTQAGTLLLVVDSPGSYSTIRVGNAPGAASKGAEKRYPMKWLLDHTLLEASSIKSSDKATQNSQWEKLSSNDSKWFRLSGDLKYPLGLEDIRYQYHLYRRL